MEMENGHPLGVFVELDKGRIAIARDFGIVLNDDSHLTLVGRNDGFRQLHTSERIIKVAAAFAGYMGLTNTRRVVTCGSASEFERSEEIVHIPADTRSAFPVISVHSPVSIQCRWQS